MSKILVFLTIILFLSSCSTQEDINTGSVENEPSQERYESISAPVRELEDSIISINELTGEQ